jgi:hypothetical protein
MGPTATERQDEKIKHHALQNYPLLTIGLVVLLSDPRVVLRHQAQMLRRLGMSPHQGMRVGVSADVICPIE